jgi:ubiquinone/menaquinone biosynthesis C-methylase UbiE
MMAGPSDAEPAADKSVNHPVFAFIFGLGSRLMICGEAKERAELLADLFGDVIEVGCGAGVNFGFYPPDVSQVLAIEPESHLREQAENAATHTAIRITVVDGLAANLPAPDASFDAGVVSLVLCSVSDPAAALAELMRVIKPGGELRFFEHVVAHNRIGATIQRGFDATIWPWLAGGCHCARDTGAAIREAGFLVESERRLTMKVPLPVIPQVVGIARRP